MADTPVTQRFESAIKETILEESPAAAKLLQRRPVPYWLTRRPGWLKQGCDLVTLVQCRQVRGLLLGHFGEVVLAGDVAVRVLDGNVLVMGVDARAELVPPLAREPPMGTRHGMYHRASSSGLTEPASFTDLSRRA
ncbi:hypothetical protein [Amycolatopsis sp. NPDC051372]|uniref:hypothetical protein n=1 Tax=unclassified Amycolatopsis TaxID=2618356 RepID=UPI00343E7378